jgi:hypothetical protein
MECKIHRSINFIRGDATAVFQDCLMFVRKRLAGWHNVITAQGRDAPDFPSTTTERHDLDTFLGRDVYVKLPQHHRQPPGLGDL